MSKNKRPYVQSAGRTRTSRNDAPKREGKDENGLHPVRLGFVPQGAEGASRDNYLVNVSGVNGEQGV